MVFAPQALYLKLPVGQYCIQVEITVRKYTKIFLNCSPAVNFSAIMSCLGPDLNRHRLKVIIFAAFRGGYAPILGDKLGLIFCAKSRLSGK